MRALLRSLKFWQKGPLWGNSSHSKPARIKPANQSTHLYQCHYTARRQSIYRSQCLVSECFLLSVESRLEAFFDEREARSRRESMPRSRQQKIKLSTETLEGCWSVASSFPFQQRSQLWLSGGLKPVKTCSQTVDLKLTLERSYGCCSIKGCFCRRVVPGALSLTLFLFFLLILAVFQAAEEAFCVNMLNLFIQWTKGGYSLILIRYLIYITFIILNLNFFLFSFVSVVTQIREFAGLGIRPLWV